MDRSALPSQGRQDYMLEMVRQHQQTLWVHFAVILLGVWQLSAPAILGYQDAGNFGADVRRVMAERALTPPEWRAQAVAWSDIASGVLMIAFGALSLLFRHRWAQWGTCAVGLWLLFAPLAFWSPDVASYTNDTLVGALAIAFSILVPLTPGMSMAAMMAPEDIPPGWEYSPSSWSQRLPVIVLAFVGFFSARYLAAYQMGHLGTLWDPFFGEGAVRIVTSDLSRAWPVADAGLGAAGYLLVALSMMMGDRRRWRTMPWAVAMFGLVVIPLAAVGVFFVAMQPLVAGTWCTLCLVAAAAMVLMLPYSFDEILATLQFLRRARGEGQSPWKVFWRGGVIAYMGLDRAPPLSVGAQALAAVSEQRQALPRTLVLSAALGLWLMFTPATLSTAGAMAHSDHLVGALVFAFSVAAFSEVARPLRIVNVPFGLWLLAAPWLLAGGSAFAAGASMLVGGLLVVLAVPRGPIRHPYDGWDRYLVW